MKIYEIPTFKLYNLNKIKEIVKSFGNKEINFFCSQECLNIYGPNIIKNIESIKEKKINIIAEAGENIGLALSLINLNVKYILISSNLDPVFIKKLSSIAKKKNINLLQNQKFKFINKQNNL